MLSSTIAGTCKQSRRCHCNNTKILTKLWIDECQSQSTQHRRRFTTSKHIDRRSALNQHQSPSLLPKRWIPATITTRSLSTQTNELSKSSSNIKKEQDYNDVLSVALD
ncbi:unnamed protein product [Mucor hiemalis]